MKAQTQELLEVVLYDQVLAERDRGVKVSIFVVYPEKGFSYFLAERIIFCVIL
jgi:hypothetical protein